MRIKTLFCINLLFLGAVSSAFAGVSTIDFSEIYNDKFQYFLPKEKMHLWLSGRGFENQDLYSEAEIKIVVELAYRLRRTVDLAKTFKCGVFTAGAPGAGKTVLLEGIIAKEGKAYVYIDPVDQLKLLYKQLIAQGMLNPELLLDPKAKKNLYDKWRSAANFIVHWGMAHAAYQGKPFYCATTSTSEDTPSYYRYFKNHGYELEVIHVTASKQVCIRSIMERDGVFYQTSSKDIEAKGKAIFDRIKDTFFIFPDKVSFYWRAEFNGNATLAGVWVKQDNKMQVESSDALNAVKKSHGEKWPKEIKEVTKSGQPDKKMKEEV